VSAIIMPRTIIEELKRRAEESGSSIEEVLLDMVTGDLDPVDKAKRYAEAAEELLEQAGEELEKGDLRQASEKIWGSAALIVKAYAFRRERKTLIKHSQLWKYKSMLAEELGDWVIDAWLIADSMHKNFYEGVAGEEDVRRALQHVERLVEAVVGRYSLKQS